MPPLIVFCADPLAPSRSDDAFADEVAAAERAGFAVAWLSYERLVDERDTAGALRRVPPIESPALALYRGWMLSTERYTALVAGLRRKGYIAFTTPEAYQACHELPSSYPFIAAHSPATVWLPQEAGLGLDQIMAVLRPFGDQPLVLKDYTKSQKHAWFEACFIPRGSDRAAVERVVRRFVELQGGDLAGGLVFRAYEPFATLGVHPQSGAPLAKEYRAVVLDGVPLLLAPYWETQEAETMPDLAPFAAVLRAVPSRFFTLDLAQREDGMWRVVELGDGQVASLPPSADRDAFYRALFAGLARQPDGGEEQVPHARGA